MKAIDTNLLARYYMDDDVVQTPRARRVMTEEPALFVSKTVLLELEWVLRGVYERSARAVNDVLRHLTQLPNVLIEDAAVVDVAVRAHGKGLDFADALHLASAARCTTLLTLDDRLARRAARLGLKPPVTAL